MGDIKNKYRKLLPCSVEVVKGHIYYWCSCGQTKNPPFSDKSCVNCQAIEFKAKNSELVSFCNCKSTKHPPFCDGSHASMLLQLLNKAT